MSQVEDGSTFEENALIKSSYVSKNTGIASLSDDSGICFCDLNNEPGVYSARWAGEEKNFDIAMYKINNSKEVENPNYKCFLCVHYHLVGLMEKTLLYLVRLMVNFRGHQKEILDLVMIQFLYHLVMTKLLLKWTLNSNIASVIEL